MTPTDNEIENAAAEIFRDSEFRVPNMYCFIKGAKWALSHQWVRTGSRVPPGTTILLCTSMMQGDRATALCVYVRDKFLIYNGKVTNKEFYPTHWMSIPYPQDEL